MSSFKLIGVLSFVCCFPLFSQASGSKAQVAECVSNRDPFSQDKCRPLKSVRCSIAVQEDQQIQVAIEGLSPLTSLLGKTYQLSGVKTGWVTRTNLNFGGYNRGMIQIYENEKSGSKNILGVEVYINHDSSGQTYTRYRCGVLRNHL